MTCGKICSGKSTWAVREARKRRGVVLSLDEMMLSLFPEGAGDQHDAYVERAERYLLDKSLEIVNAGTDVILDWGFWTRQQREKAKAFFDAHRIPWSFRYFPLEPEEAARRIVLRNEEVQAGKVQAFSVDEGLLRKMDSLFEEPSPEELRPPREEPPRRTTLEEVGNAVTHGVGALLSVAGMVLMLLKADTGPKLISGWIYGICLVLMFLMSCLYHAFRWGSRVKRVWRRFDYSSIYLLIGGTFTPMWLVYWGNRTGIILCIVQWAIILTGITLIGIFGPGKAKAVHMTLYIVLGWSALVFLPGMLRNDLPLFIYTLAGGVLYTLGIIPFARKSRGAHFIWHFFVLFGALTQWLGIYQYVF